MKQSAFLFLLLFPLLLSAQRNFQPGCIVNAGGDTLRGYIDYREWNYSPTGILFRPQKAVGGEVKFGVADLQYFEINKTEAYRRAVVRISLDAISIGDVRTRDTASKTDTVFLKLIETGPVASLYSYTDELKERFYISAGPGEEPEELSYREYLREDTLTRLITEERFKIQLNALTYRKKVATASLSDMIARASYKKHDLARIVRQMNPTSAAAARLTNQQSSFRPFVAIALQKTALTVSGDHLFARAGASNQSRVLPKISGGIDLFLNGNVRRLLVRGELAFQTSRISLAGSEPDLSASYELASSTVSLSPQLVLNAYNTAALKLPVSVGISLLYAGYSQNNYVETSVYGSGTRTVKKDNYFELNRLYGALLFRAGLVVHDKVEASVVYQPSTRLTANTKYHLSNTVAQFQLAYLFR